MSASHDGGPMPGDPPAERVLLFRLQGRLHAIRAADVGGVVSCETLRRVPGSPDRVLGLAEWRGSILTVLDLPGLLGRAPEDDGVCLVRLAPPLEQTALFLPASVQLTESHLECGATDGADELELAWYCGGEAVCLVDPPRLVRQVEEETRERI